MNGNADNLMSRFYYLTTISQIPDMGQYAQDLADLAADFEQADRPAMADLVRSKAVQYATQPDGAYIRVKQGESMVELVPFTGMV